MTVQLHSIGCYRHLAMRSPPDNDGLAHSDFQNEIPGKNSLGNDTAGGKSKHGYELVGFS